MTHVFLLDRAYDHYGHDKSCPYECGAPDRSDLMTDDIAIYQYPKRDSHRLKGYDYSKEGLYFVTICAKDKRHYFGEIENDRVILNEIGSIVRFYWYSISSYHPYSCVHEFIVMPNHIHGIVEITEQDNAYEIRDHNSQKNDTMNNPVKHKNLARVVRWYKGRTTYECHQKDLDFKWQTRFHDHIIRDSGDLQRLIKYIDDNPARWNMDRFYNPLYF